MFSTLRTKFGIPGIISVIALVFALVGGAVAANNSGDGATASAKAKKGPRGPKGPAGPAGPAGAQGPAGPAGANGKDGTNGTNGSVGPTGPTGPEGDAGEDGQNGTNGVSANAVNEPKGANCKEGGVKVTSASPTAYVCNGSPWTAGGTLPSGQTETGAWGYGWTTSQTNSTATQYEMISFPIPLADELDVEHVHFINRAGFEVTSYEGNRTEEGATSTACLGTYANPTAAPGHLCVYAAKWGGLNYGNEPAKNPLVWNNYIYKPDAGEFSNGAGRTGALIFFEAVALSSYGTGTWAVTAP